MTSWAGVVSTCPSLVIELSEVADEVTSAMTRWGLASYDAVHATTAIYAGTNVILTLDARFGHVPPRLLDVYVDRSRGSACRRRREGRTS